MEEHSDWLLIGCGVLPLTACLLLSLAGLELDNASEREKYVGTPALPPITSSYTGIPSSGCREAVTTCPSGLVQPGSSNLGYTCGPDGRSWYTGAPTSIKCVP